MGFSDFTKSAKFSPIGYCSLEKNSNGISSGVFVGLPSESITVTKIFNFRLISDGPNFGNTDNFNAVRMTRR